MNCQAPVSWIPASSDSHRTISETPEAAQNFRQQGRRESGRRSVLFLYVEVGGRLRTKLEEIFSSRLEVAYGALEDGDLRHRIAGRFQLCANLLFEVGGVAHAVD